MKKFASGRNGLTVELLLSGTTRWETFNGDGPAYIRPLEVGVEYTVRMTRAE